MRISIRSGALLAAVALLIGASFLFHGIATAGDDVPAAKVQPTKAEEPATATPSPMHSVMKWIGSEVMPGAESPCPSTAAGEKAWRGWFAAKEAPLTGLRNALVADGWNADRFVGFFQKMASQKSCSDCPENCDKAKSGASAPTGDAGATGSSSCDGGGCNKAKKSCCGSCDKAKGASAPTGDAGKTGSSSCDGGGCDKAKKSCGGGGCDKAKGASAPTGDAGKTGSASPDAGKCGGSKCPCTGKNKADCEGCDKAGCDCGK